MYIICGRGRYADLISLQVKGMLGPRIDWGDLNDIEFLNPRTKRPTSLAWRFRALFRLRTSERSARQMSNLFPTALTLPRTCQRFRHTCGRAPASLPADVDVGDVREGHVLAQHQHLVRVRNVALDEPLGCVRKHKVSVAPNARCIGDDRFGPL